MFCMKSAIQIKFIIGGNMYFNSSCHLLSLFHGLQPKSIEWKIKNVLAAVLYTTHPPNKKSFKDSMASLYQKKVLAMLIKSFSYLEFMGNFNAQHLPNLLSNLRAPFQSHPQNYTWRRWERRRGRSCTLTVRVEREKGRQRWIVAVIIIIIIIIQMVLLGVFTWFMQMKVLKGGQQRPQAAY